ncbi:MAG: glycosyltransferase family 4 protein [Alphaproteobacteria bacterium]|tara:strand:+ start:5025 stop:6203 length:1179 start_codon:yes stop_codon:yes gene_type:complete
MSKSNLNYKNKRILQIIPNMEIGGAERTVLEITSFLKDTNFSSLVLTSGGKLIDDLEKANIEVIKLKIDKKNPYSIIKNFFLFIKIFREKKINLVHVRSRAPAWSAIFAAKKLGIPVLTTWHGHVSNSSFIKKIYNSIMLKGDAVIANSIYTAENISKIYGINKSKIDIIPRGVDVNNFKKSDINSHEIAKIKENWKIFDKEKVIILLPARLTKWKGHEVAIEAINLLKGESFFKNIVCLFAGEQKNSEKYIHNLNRLISSYSLEKKIRLIGKVENMPLAYHASDVILSPSIEPEPFGRIPIEAQASGKIIISCDAGAVKDTIKSGKNFTGFKAIPNNSESLADKIKIALKMENEEIQGMQKRAIMNVKNNFSLESMCKKTLEVYNRLLISK